MDVSMIAKFKDVNIFISNFNECDIGRNFNGKSLLFYSISNSNIENRYAITNYLLDKGANAKVINECNESLLHVLLGQVNHDLSKTTALCKRLINLGANRNQLDSKNRLALQYIVNLKYSDEELAELYNVWFSVSDVLVSTKNAWGKSPIELAEQISYRRKLLAIMKMCE